MLQDPDLLALQEVRTKVQNAYAAWQTYRAFSQEQLDAVVERMGAAARAHARRLAELAVEETGYGNAADKYAKNLLACDLLVRTMRGMRTAGVLREDPAQKIVEFAVPMGVIAAILPTTNPTSTAMYKILIALKAGNAIVLSPHPRAKRCTCETAEILYQAARQAGAPENIIQCIDASSIEATNELMRHRRTAAILSTGGSGIVRAAYSSGKPAFGVGPGNVPVIVDASADIPYAVENIIRGKSFDYGTLCSSEQALIAEHGLRDKILAELKARKAFLCDDKQQDALAKLLLLPPKWSVNPTCVGQHPQKIARMAGFEVPQDTSILVVEIKGVGKDHPLSAEKLSPVLSVYWARDWKCALDTTEAVLRFGGLGHTCGIYAKDEARIREFAARMPAMRMVCNSPTPLGSTGITTNLFPAMTLGCGAIAGNITGDNIGPQHLINIKRLAYHAREAEDAFDKTAEAASVTSTVQADIGSAVERFLAQRGFVPNAPHNTAPAPASNPAVIVDRFLSSRLPAPPPAPEPPPAAPEPANADRPAPDPVVVDFVAENDVRAAIQKSAKIYIGPKTIVTPSARDLASQHDILVNTKRT